VSRRLEGDDLEFTRQLFEVNRNSGLPDGQSQACLLKGNSRQIELRLRAQEPVLNTDIRWRSAVCDGKPSIPSE